MRLALCQYRGRTYAAQERAGALALMTPVDGGLVGLAYQGGVTRPDMVVGIDEVEFLQPVMRPGKILCIGFNYREHVEEAGAEMPKYPSIFVRYPESQVGHRQPVVVPALTTMFDYEGELAVIIGKPGWRLDKENAMDHVSGYACFADNSARDFQFHTRQATSGKNFLSTGAFGPWLTTADEVPDPSALRLTTRINGVVVQDCGLSDLIFSVADLIVYITQFMRLMPGDVIVSGTPAGVGGARKPQLWLKPGDTLEVEVPGVGHLINPVIAEADAIL